ncbi:unnamed protein product [Orchesella dallaii]|uniref:Uncharacterized protein n=1 Tax=Orchesella dallaii TaxID=48710 RepID=A0ABP1QKQ2_9HEXA
MKYQHNIFAASRTTILEAKKRPWSVVCWRLESCMEPYLLQLPLFGVRELVKVSTQIFILAKSSRPVGSSKSCFTYKGGLECCVFIWGKVSPQSLLEFLSHGQNQIVNFFDSTQKNAAKIVQFENDRIVSQLFYEVEQAPNVMIEGNPILLVRGVDYLVDGSEDPNSKKEVEFDNFLEKTHEGLSTLLWSEFTEIYDEVISPKDDFVFVFSILERTRNIVELLDPSVKLSLFRHCYMKEMVIYAFFPNLPPSCTTSGRIGHRRLAWQLQKAAIEVVNCNVETDEITLLDKQTGIEFRLICNPLQEQEGVVNELHKLLFTFDPRGRRC